MTVLASTYLLGATHIVDFLAFLFMQMQVQDFVCDGQLALCLTSRSIRRSIRAGVRGAVRVRALLTMAAVAIVAVVRVLVVVVGSIRVGAWSRRLILIRTRIGTRSRRSRRVALLLRLLLLPLVVPLAVGFVTAVRRVGIGLVRIAGAGTVGLLLVLLTVRAVWIRSPIAVLVLLAVVVGVRTALATTTAVPSTSIVAPSSLALRTVATTAIGFELVVTLAHAAEEALAKLAALLDRVWAWAPVIS